MKRNFLDLDDDHLVTIFQNDTSEESTAAFGELINRHYPKMLSDQKFYTRNEDQAMDNVQEIILKVMNILRNGKYKKTNHFSAWISRVGHNYFVDTCRKRNRIGKYTKDFNENFHYHAQIFTEQNMEDKIIWKETLEELGRLIEFLLPEQRDVVVLRIYGGLSFKEITALMKDTTSVSTSLGRMRYALINLRKMAQVDQKCA